MQLRVTGLVVRAARTARIAAPPGRVVGIALRQIRRTASTQAAAREDSSSSEAFPEQSASLLHEVDPSKTAAASAVQPKSGHPREWFKRELKRRNAPNKIIHDSGHSGVLINSNPYVFDQTSNLTQSILDCVGCNLYENPNHPLGITRALIEDVFPSPTFKNHIATNPVVSTTDNFDVLGFPKDHPGRSRTDTYYVDSDHVLRTHTSAHEHTAFQYMLHHPEPGYTICADVYRRDSIDRSHFPVFHQMEGARTWKLMSPSLKARYQLPLYRARRRQIEEDISALPTADLEVEQCPSFDLKTNAPQIVHDEPDVVLMVTHLKKSLENLVYRVFTAAREAGIEKSNQTLKVRWVEAYFPFTAPSFELEVFWQGEWLELLGCGITQQSILKNAGLNDHLGWAWGLGMERLAMVLFGIPDIRLFWSEDKRFLDQYQQGKITKFEPFSKYPACYKDVAFWIDASPAAASPIGTGSTDSGVAASAGGDATKASPAETQPAAFHENDVMEIVRDVAGALVEDVKLVDEFVHPSNGRKSLCYRINYRSLEKTLTNDEVNQMHSEVVARMAAELEIELR